MSGGYRLRSLCQELKSASRSSGEWHRVLQAESRRDRVALAGSGELSVLDDGTDEETKGSDVGLDVGDLERSSERVGEVDDRVGLGSERGQN